MMTSTLPICQLCKSEVTGTTATTENIFTPEGIEQTFFSVKLSCGCIVDFPTFDVDMKNATQTLRDGFTDQPVLTYLDSELVDEDLYEGDDFE